MPFWEQHKTVLLCLGTFVVLLGLVWLLALRDYEQKAAGLERDFADSQKERDKFCPGEKGLPVQRAEEQFDNANRDLDKAFKALRDRLHFKFPDALIPEAEKGRAPVYVRNRHNALKDYVLQEAETKRQIRVTPEAASLGLLMPEDYSESLDQDLEWLRQLVVVQRAVDMLFQVCEEKDARGVTLRHLAGFYAIRPMPPVKTGPPPVFLREYPVEFEILVSLRGMLRILELCSTTESFHVVQSLEITARDRRSLPYQADDKQAMKSDRWFEHLYQVKLRLAALTLTEEEGKAPTPAAAGSSAGISVPIPH